jgi:hypothetical protein
MKSLVFAGFLLLFPLFALADDADDRSGPMTLDRMGEIILKIAPDAKRVKGSWRFNIEGYQVSIFTDENADRMRIIVPVESAENIPPKRMYRLMQANFDSALDARYSVAQEILWSAYIHPLKSLDDREFISGLGQVINLAETYGTAYTSGAIVFGGGDSQALRRRELIDELLKKGLSI